MIALGKKYLLYIENFLKGKAMQHDYLLFCHCGSILRSFLCCFLYPDGKHVGKGPVKPFHNVIFIALNKFSQQMRIHPHLGY